MSAAAAYVVTPLGVVWTPDEDAVVVAKYRKLGPRRVAAKLPGRTASAVEHRARVLGCQKFTHWTPAEDRKLTMLWGESTVIGLAREFGRSRLAICARAHALGLKFGAQDGMESIRDAAKRTGYSREGLMSILRWANVETKPVPSWYTRKAKYHWLQVDPFDVDEAIERWLACETVNAAAEQRGVNSKRLREWLLASEDADVPPKPPGKGRWRVPSDVIDRVVAKYAPQRGTEQTNNKA